MKQSECKKSKATLFEVALSPLFKFKTLISKFQNFYLSYKTIKLKKNTSCKNHKFTSPISILRSQRGFFILTVTIILSALTLAFSGITYVLLHKKTAIRTSEEIAFRISLNGLSSYVFSGIQERWCFSNQLAPVSDCGPSPLNTLTHPRSSERLLLNAVSLTQLSQAKNDAEAGITDSSSTTIPDDIDGIPLYSFPQTTLTPAIISAGNFLLRDAFEDYTNNLGNPNKIQILSIDVFVERTREADVRGLEQNILVELRTKYMYQGVEKKHTLSRIVTFFPRELNTFSLILGRNLWLYQGSTTSGTQGASLCKPAVTTDAVIPDTTTGGLHFKSPVFVNGDIHLNPDKTKKTRVVFGSSLVLGGGQLRQGTASYNPEKPGDLISKISTVGGFTKGIQFEEADKGLKVFSGQEACQDTGEALRVCIERGELGSPDAPREIDITVPLDDVEEIITTEDLHISCAKTSSGALKCWGQGEGYSGDRSKDLLYATQMPGWEARVKKLSSYTNNPYFITEQGGFVDLKGHLSPLTIYPGLETGVTDSCRTHWGGVKDYFVVQNGGLKTVVSWSGFGSSQVGFVRSSPFEAVSGYTSGVTGLACTNRIVCIIHNGTVKCKGKQEALYGPWLGTGSDDAKIETDFVESIGLGSGVTKIGGTPNGFCAVKGGGLYCWGSFFPNQAIFMNKHRNNSNLPDISNTPLHYQIPATCSSGVGGIECHSPTHFLYRSKGITMKTYNLFCYDADDKIHCAGSGHISPPFDHPLSSSFRGQHDVRCFIVEGGHVKCAGRNNYGDLGNGTRVDTDDAHPYHQGVPPIVSAPSGDYVLEQFKVKTKSVALGKSHTCTLIGGNVKCWGDNFRKQLGRGSVNQSADELRSPEDVVVPGTISSSLEDVIDISAGDDHTCAVKEDGSVWCWGEGRQGQIGNGNSLQQDKARRVSGITNAAVVYSGKYHNCALLKTGEIKCWGDNAWGKLGNGGGPAIQNTPVSVIRKAGSTDLLYAKEISLGYSHSCALLGSGKVKCWGYNADGRLGDGSTTYRSIPTAVMDGSRELEHVAQISLGSFHSCALFGPGAAYRYGLDGSVVCWGRSDNNQARNSTPDLQDYYGGIGHAMKFKSISSGNNHNCAVSESNKVYCWGDNSDLQSGKASPATIPNDRQDRTGDGQDTGISKAQVVYSGSSQNCMLDLENTISCWGRNDFGQLGDGTTDNSHEPVAITACTQQGGANQEMFSALDWGIDLSPYTIHSWNVTGDNPAEGDSRSYSAESFTLDNGNAFSLNSDIGFHVQSIVKTCTVKATANLVAGFLVCYEFIIESRSTPLTIVGTVITNKLQIAKSAVESGITWSNIYDQQAILKMKESKILATTSGGRCPAENIFKNANHPQHQADSYSCSPNNLRGNMDPMRWSTVDPDCGTQNPAAQATSCKRHVKKFILKEIYREER